MCYIRKRTYEQFIPTEKSFCDSCTLSSQFSIYWIIKQYLLNAVLAHSDITKLSGVETSFASLVLSKHKKKSSLGWKKTPLHLNNTFQTGAYESILDSAVSYGPGWLLEHLFLTQSHVCMMSGLTQQLICSFLKLDYKVYFTSAGGAAEQSCPSNCGWAFVVLYLRRSEFIHLH